MLNVRKHKERYKGNEYFQLYKLFYQFTKKTWKNLIVLDVNRWQLLVLEGA